MGRLPRQGLSAVVSAGARVAAGHHLCCCPMPRRVTMCLNEGQLDDNSLRTVAHLWVKVRPRRRSKPTRSCSSTEPGSGAGLLADSVRRATARLLAAPIGGAGGGRSRLRGRPPSPRARGHGEVTAASADARSSPVHCRHPGASPPDLRAVPVTGYHAVSAAGDGPFHACFPGARHKD